MVRKIFLSLILVLSICNKSIATNEKIIAQQSSTLKITDFTKEANKYTKETFPELDADNILNMAIQGKTEPKKLFRPILQLISKEIVNTLQTFGAVLLIIIIHSLLKSITDGLKNSSVSDIVFFTQYLLIVAVVMTNFTEIIELTKNTIQNLVGFSNNLVPLLITLLITTRQHSFCKCNATHYTFSNTIYWQYNYCSNTTCSNDSNHTWCSFKLI